MKTIIPALTIITAFLLFPTFSAGQLPNPGNLASFGSNNNPVVIPLLLMHGAMSKVYAKASTYYTQHNACAPEGSLLSRFGGGNAISHITNKKDCSIEATFGDNAPAGLQGKTMRIVPSCSSPPTGCDFGKQLSVTDIGFGSNSPSLFARPPTPFAPSPTAQAASLDIPAVPTNIAVSASYDEISRSAKKTASGSSHGLGDSNSPSTGTTTATVSSSS